MIPYDQYTNVQKTNTNAMVQTKINMVIRRIKETREEVIKPKFLSYTIKRKDKSVVKKTVSTHSEFLTSI